MLRCFAYVHNAPEVCCAVLCCAMLSQTQRSILQPLIQQRLGLQELCQKIIKGVYNTPAHISAEAKDLLGRMLTVVPDHRITFEQVGAHCRSGFCVIDLIMLSTSYAVICQIPQVCCFTFAVTSFVLLAPKASHQTVLFLTLPSVRPPILDLLLIVSYCDLV